MAPPKWQKFLPELAYLVQSLSSIALLSRPEFKIIFTPVDIQLIPILGLVQVCSVNVLHRPKVGHQKKILKSTERFRHM